MKKTKEKSSICKPIIAGVALLLIGVISFTISKFWDNVNCWLSIFGSICSIIGLTIACYQIFKIKNISEQTKEAIDTNIKSVNKYLTFSDTTRIIKLIDEIVLVLQSKRIEIAFQLLKELKVFLLEIQCNDKISKYISKEIPLLSGHIQDITTDIINLDSAITKKEKIDYQKIRQNAEYVQETLVKINSKLKYTEL